MTSQAAAQQQKQEEAICKSVAVDDLGPCKRRIRVEVAPETIRKSLDEMFENLRRTAAVPGFRVGRAPRDLLERKFGKGVEADLREDLVEKALHEALEAQGLEALRHPRVEESSLAFDVAKGLSFAAEVLVWPVFEVKGYQGLALSRRKISVDDDEIARGLEDLRKRKAQWVPAEGAIQAADLVIGKVTLAVEGHDPIVREGFTILLEEGMVGEIPAGDLAQRFIGKNAGDTVEIPVDVPVTFTVEALRGRKGTVTVVVDEIKRARLPDLDEAFARQYHAEGVAALRESVREAILREKERMADLDLEAQIHEALIAAMPFELPEEVVVAESYRILQRYERSLAARGFPPEAIEEQVRRVQKNARAEATRRLRTFFILEKIAEKERIYASEQEVDRAIAAMASAMGQRPERLRAESARDGSLDDIRTQLRHGKVIDHIKSKAQITEA